MLSEFLEGTYKRYKNDTSTFLKWLYETGTKCGYVPSAPAAAKKQEESAPAKTARLKGKARKEAKAAKHVTPSIPDTNTGAPSHKVPLRDLLPLAQAMLDSKDPSIKVPVEILQAGLRAVSDRKKLTDNFSKNTEASDVETLESNGSHSYFSTLMERVILTLQPRFATMAGTNTKEKAPAQKNKTIADLVNRFAVLEVEEPTEVDLSTLDARTTTKTTLPEPAEPNHEFYEAEEDTLEAKTFAFYCLFTDLNKLRSYVELVWGDYKAGKLDLITASVVTNTAIQLAIRTQDEFVASFSGTDSYKDNWVALSPEMGMKMFEEGGQTFDMFGMWTINADVEDWIFHDAHSMLYEFTKVLNPGCVPMIKRGFYGVYQPKVDRSRMSRSEKKVEDMQVFMEILPEFCFLAKCNIPMIGQDEITRGLRQFALTKEIPIWLAFAVEIFLNIHHVLRETVDSGFQVLTRTATHFTQTLDQYFELSDGFVKSKRWPKENEQLFHHLKDLMDIQIFSDPILPNRTLHHKTVGWPAPQESERFYLYKRHPLLCGITAFNLTLWQQEYGMTVANGMGTAIFPAHFYNALRQKQNGIAPWPMMEELINIHGEHHIFLGSKPTTIMDSYKQIVLTLGHSVEDFSANLRKRKLKPSKKGPRGLKETSPLSELFHQDLTVEGNAVGDKSALTMHRVEALLTEQALDAEVASNPVSKRVRHKMAATKQLSPLDLLDALMVSIPQELPKLRYDYFELHRQSIGVLRKMRDEMDEDFKKYIGVGYLENESQLPFLGPYTLSIAIGSLKTANAFGIPTNNAGSKVLEKAGEVMERYVTELEHDLD